MSTLSCDNSENAIHCELKILSDDSESKNISSANSTDEISPSVLKENISILNLEPRRNTSEFKKISKMMKEIEDCSLDISKVTSRTRKSYSSVVKESNDKTQIKPELNSQESVQVQSFDNIEHQEKVNSASSSCNNNDNDKENLLDLPIDPIKPEQDSRSKPAKSPNGIVKRKSSSSKRDDLSTSSRTDENDRKAKSTNKLIFSCYECLAEFETFSQFKTHRVIHDFESQGNIPLPSPGTTATETNSVTDDVTSSETASEHKYLAEKQPPKKRKIDRDALSSEPDQDKSDLKFSCKQCGQVYDKKQNLTKHNDLFHKKKTAKNPSKPISVLKPENNVDQSSKKTDFKQWTALHNIPEFGCPICGLGFAKLDKLENHRNKEHQNFQIPRKKAYR